MTPLCPIPQAIRPAFAFALGVLLATAAGCGKEDRPANPPAPAKAVATAEGQTQVIGPATTTVTNQRASP